MRLVTDAIVAAAGWSKLDAGTNSASARPCSDCRRGAMSLALSMPTLTSCSPWEPTIFSNLLTKATSLSSPDCRRFQAASPKEAAFLMKSQVASRSGMLEHAGHQRVTMLPGRDELAATVRDRGEHNREVTAGRGLDAPLVSSGW